MNNLNKITFISNSPKESMSLGEEIGKQITKPIVLFLHSELGGGKTTLIKGIGKGLNVPNNEITIVSPTFTIMNVYQGRMPMYHYDLYRLKNSSEAEELDFAHSHNNGCILVEWPSLLKNIVLPNVNIYIKYIDMSKREFSIEILNKCPIKFNLHNFEPF